MAEYMGKYTPGCQGVLLVWLARKHQSKER